MWRTSATGMSGRSSRFTDRATTLITPLRRSSFPSITTNGSALTASRQASWTGGARPGQALERLARGLAARREIRSRHERPAALALGHQLLHVGGPHAVHVAQAHPDGASLGAADRGAQLH